MELKQGTDRFFMLDDNREIGEVTFTEEQPSVISINHTFVNPDYRGQHIARQLVQAVIDKAEKEHKLIRPVCSYARALFARNKDIQQFLYKQP